MRQRGFKVIAFDGKGHCRHLHDDALIGIGVRLQGTKGIPVRASHVEPDPQSGDWYADMSPVDGPKLGPFETREKALFEEVRWLNANRL